MKKLTFLIALLAFATFLLVTRAGNSILVGAARWLVVGTTPRHADLIVALGGDRGRQETAVELLHRGYGPRVLFVGADARERDYACLGVSPSEEVPLLEPAYTTGEEADHVRDLVRQRGYHSVLIVTAPYHSRRARWIFRRALAGTGATVEVSTTVIRAFTMDQWWTSHMGQKTIIGEYAGLVYYWILGLRR